MARSLAQVLLGGWGGECLHPNRSLGERSKGHRSLGVTPGSGLAQSFMEPH